MICEKCGISYEGNFCPNGCNSPMAQKPKKSVFKKWWFWVLVAVVALLFFSCVGGGEEAPADGPVKVEETTVENNVVEEEDVVVTEEVTVEVTDALQEDSDVYTVGDVIDSYGLLVTYESAEVWEDYNKYSAPEEGYQYIRLFLSAENTTDEDAYISFAEFECYADGVKVEDYYGGDDRLDGGTLSSGRKTKGYIYFVVPVDAEEIEVEYELNIWTDERAVLVVDL